MMFKTESACEYLLSYKFFKTFYFFLIASYIFKIWAKITIGLFLCLSVSCTLCIANMNPNICDFASMSHIYTRMSHTYEHFTHILITTSQYTI